MTIQVVGMTVQLSRKCWTTMSASVVVIKVWWLTTPKERTCLTNYTGLVYTIYTMKNITLSADEKLIEDARKRARENDTTLNEAFRDWLVQYAHNRQTLVNYDRLMAKAPFFISKRKYTREELNER